MVKADDGSTNTQTFDNEGFDALDVGTMKENGGAFNGISAKEPESKEVEDVIEPETKKSKLDLDIEDGKSNDHEENVNFQMTLWKHIYRVTDKVSLELTKNKTVIVNVIKTVFLLLFAAYLIYACIYDFEEAFVVLIFTSLAALGATYALVRNTKGDVIFEKCLYPMWQMAVRGVEKTKWILAVLAVVGFGVILFFLTRENPIQLVSFGGLVIFTVLLYVFSKYPEKVKWRPVIWGLVLQFIFGILILRTYPGYVLFQWIGNVVQAFLGFSRAGSLFLFGENYNEHYFAFAVLPIIIYFSSAISILYYIGAMQFVIRKLAWVMQRTMKTSASESLNAAGNIFIGQTEAPLLIRPFLKDMTRSEIHAVMTGGFATIAGSVLGAYVLSGISAAHLVSASVMSAPAALAVSKLFYPETEKSKTANSDNLVIEKGTERNFIEAAASGASTAIPLVLNIAANLVAFISLLALVNALLSYFGGLVGYPELTFELICSYVFMPVAFIMGVEWADCRLVAELIGIKTFVNEFVAYDKLATFIDNRETGAGPTLSERSEVIATYALCGFANISSIGVQLGGLAPLAPSRKPDLAAVVIRALIAGTTACFMTACIAGILFVPEEVVSGNVTTPIPMTTIY
ncbi:solute carrier family 28 member 3 [Strongylocentrotus purpuratus]|uniref:Sodium/nucleoside cotransporter n=1 Tax=Strongylocentrotus purpuratus TaxID=7668 RepID=A0A7M7P669_STRPU|nr:solute carrier family 28 member 3 [Strongylocentrotus purpuratus]